MKFAYLISIYDDFYFKKHASQEEETKICAKSPGVGNEMKQHIKKQTSHHSTQFYLTIEVFRGFRTQICSDKQIDRPNISRDGCHVWLIISHAEWLLARSSRDVD